MKDLAGKYTMKGDSVMDFCASPRLKSKACMLFDQHRKFVGCGLASDTLDAVEPDLVSTFYFAAFKPKFGHYGRRRDESGG